MALTTLTGSAQAGAINYTYRTSGSADWASVPTASYFYDQIDQQVRYKNTAGDIQSVYTFPYTGSAVISGSLTVTGSIYGTISSASYAATASYLEGSVVSASYAATASYVVTAQTASYVLQAVSSSYATTASYALNAAAASSFPYTGSAIISGSLDVTGSINATLGVTASLQGTASWANNALTSSYIVTAQTASYVQIAQTASYVLNAISSSFSTTSQNANTASYVTIAQTASYITTAQTASYVLNAVSSSFSSTSSYLNTLNQDLTFNGNLTLNGTASISYLNVVYETASVILSTGSNQLGDATSDTQTLIGTVIVSGSQQITGSLIISDNTSADLVRITQTGTGNAFVVEDSTNPDTSPFVIDSSGNIGIGTTSITRKLHLSGGTAYIENPSSNALLLDRAAGIATIKGGTGGTGTNLVIDSANSQILFLQNYHSGDVVMVSGGGYVGVGTSLPNAKLHINNTSSFDSLLVEDSTNPDTTPFVIDTSGNVGIGTTSITSKLTVSASDVNGILLGTNTGTGLQEQSGRLMFGSITTSNTVTMYASSGSLSIATGGTPNVSSGTTRLFVSSSGNVGIGTAFPTLGTLQVNGNVYATSFTGSLRGTASYAPNIYNSDGILPTGIARQVDLNGSGLTFTDGFGTAQFRSYMDDGASISDIVQTIGSIVLNVQGGGTGKSLYIDQSSIGLDGKFVVSNSSTTSYQLITGTSINLSNDLIVTGSVGIGKSPTSKLDISGSALITGSLRVTAGITGSLQLTSTPTLNNANTEILTRNSSTGDLEYSTAASTAFYPYGIGFAQAIGNFLT